MGHNIQFKKEKDLKIITKECVYNSHLKVNRYQLKHRLFSGEWSQTLNREVCDRPPAAAALLYDPIKDNVILIEQFRVGALQDEQPWLLEIVAGIADKQNEDIVAMIKREMLEESGLTAKSLYKMCECWMSPGASNEYLTLYCAKVDTPEGNGIYGSQDENEDIFLHIFNTKEAFDLLTNGKIKNAITIMGLQWLALNKKTLDRIWITNEKDVTN